MAQSQPANPGEYARRAGPDSPAVATKISWTHGSDNGEPLRKDQAYLIRSFRGSGRRVRR